MPELLPPEGSPDLGYRIFDLVAQILKYKQSLGLPEKWNRSNELVWNKHWRGKHKEIKLLSPNLLHAHLRRTVNQLTDNHPIFNVSRITEGPEDEERFDSLLKTCEHWWGEEEIQHVLEKAILQGEVYGATPSKVVFNPDREFGMGEVEIEVIDPFYYGMYPLKCQEPQKALAILHFFPMSLMEAKNQWPEHEKTIQADQDVLKDLGDSRQQIQAASTQPGEEGVFAKFVDAVKEVLAGGGSTGEDITDQVMVVECWAKDFTKEDGQPKYPGWIRCITVCNGGALVLSDRKNPNVNPDIPFDKAKDTYLYDRFPFAFVPSITDTLSPWGMSDFEQLEGLQEEIDKTITQLSYLKDKALGAKMVNPITSGVHRSQLTNKPGIIEPHTAQHGIGWLPGLKIPPELMPILGLLKDWFFLVAGTFELESAQTPGREVIAAKAISALLERASTMLRGKIRNYSRMIREWGRMYLSLVMHFYTEDRFIAVEEDGQKVPRKIRGTDMIVPARLSVVSGSTMPRAQIQEREEAIELGKMGMLPASEVLKKLDWPNWKAVVRQMEAGPIGEFLGMLAQLGVPEPIIQYFQQISQMEPKDLEKAREQGDLPDFAAVLSQMAEAGSGGVETPDAPPDPIMDMEIQERQAKITKLQAEAALVQEKIQTERVDQWVKQQGVNLDGQQINLERAKFVSDLENKPRDITPSAKKHGQGPYREQGLVSNNAELEG